MDAFEDPSTTRETILGAAFRALCEHGYADLTIEAIGAEFEKSPSLVYHHYEDKDDLLLGLLEYLLEEFQAEVPDGDGDAMPEGPDEWVTLFIDRNIDIDPPERQTEQFLLAIIELRAQATHDPTYRDHFDRSDRVFHRLLSEVIEEGLEDGTFTAQDVDPEAVSATLLALATGMACHWGSTTDRDWLAPIADEARAYVQGRLYEEAGGT